METEAKLRRLHHIEKMTIKALARQTGMSRNPIRRVLRADKAGHFYQRKIQPMPALGAYIDTLIFHILLLISDVVQHNEAFTSVRLVLIDNN